MRCCIGHGIGRRLDAPSQPLKMTPGWVGGSTGLPSVRIARVPSNPATALNSIRSHRGQYADLGFEETSMVQSGVLYRGSLHRCFLTNPKFSRRLTV